MKKLLKLTAAVIAMLVASCGSNDHYTVDGVINGIGTRNLRLYYYDENGMKLGVISSLDGKFAFTGNAKKQTLLSIATNQRGIITTIAVENGDYVKLRYTLNEPWTLEADGNDINSALTSFVKKNAEILKEGNVAEINGAVADYVAANPNKEASGVMAALFYDSLSDPEGYNKITEMLSPEIAESNLVQGYLMTVAQQTKEQMAQRLAPMTLFSDADSIITFNPAKYPKGTLITLTDGSSAWKDSINSMLGSLPEDVQVLNINLEGDTAAWHSSLRDNPEQRGTNVWTPGSVASPRLSGISPIVRLPMFMAVDDTGKRLYQGQSLGLAMEKLKR